MANSQWHKRCHLVSEEDKSEMIIGVNFCFEQLTAVIIDAASCCEVSAMGRNKEIVGEPEVMFVLVAEPGVLSAAAASATKTAR